jgi:anti-sigma factor RsiW
MITCRQLLELLLDYVSGELPPEMHRHLEEHVRKCPPCLHSLESYRATIQLTRRLPQQPPPPGLLHRFLAALRSGHGNQPGDGS